MERVPLVWAVHNHQPVGNFDFVFEHFTERCYAPLLSILERHPRIRLAMHWSGSLFEWLEAHRPRVLDALGQLVDRRQIELLGGGFYEPMLTSLPWDDALGQLSMMREYLLRRFGTDPQGVWLAERVWEPELASLLARAGARYTLLDDTHFFYAGVEPGRLSGYYLTEKTGDPLAVFPIDQKLRYLVPFRAVDEVLADVAGAAAAGTRGLIYGDDGEKFGGWPGTHEWVIEKGWLERFFTDLEEEGAVELMSPADYLGRFPPSGRIYLPTSSYEEMLTWALPTPAIHRYEDLREELERRGLYEQARPFLRGGQWLNFMAKYTEANHLHKRMLVVSRKLQAARASGEADEAMLAPVQQALFRGQCNCAYWHGLFGGLYLPHLRDSVYRELIHAENLLDEHTTGGRNWLSFEQLDFDADLEEEIIVESRWINAYFDPAAGGTLVELDYRPARFNLTNVLTRREESYHRKLDRTLPSGQPDPRREGEPPLEQILFTDALPRRSLLDRFPSRETTVFDLLQANYEEEGDFLGAPYQVDEALLHEEGEHGFQFELRMSREGFLRRNGWQLPLRVEKHVVMGPDQPELTIHYNLTNLHHGDLEGVFCPEFNLTLLAGDHPDRFFEYEGMCGSPPRTQSIGTLADLSWFGFTDRYQGFRVIVSLSPATTVWRHPIETVSRSDHGLEKNHQGFALLPRWELALRPGEIGRRSITLKIHSLSEPRDHETTKGKGETQR